ncbi:NAD(P)-dependent alcohol dehydrogenase [Tannockella kyphosi]|uniref:NAD(P)-dependent alcohol dehydrogenase n=1 Tax=Tannockella kyphosi TaxID=2899121 RepID=UPI002011396A|nr:NAD(P)-dependent alcohol dehydrogenase [Tannockella kyphosi]
MKGYAMKKIGSTGWLEKEIPTIGPNDALVRPTAVSPCTSDIHTVWAGALGERTDMILGHEAVGVVEEVGELVTDFKKGDRVLVAAITPDWNSVEAQKGFPMHSGGMLAGWKFSNFKDGVFAEYFHVNDADGNLAHIPDEVDDISAVMLCDMMPTGFHGVELADIKFGETVLVVGIGPVGLMAVAGAKLRGASEIYAVGSRPNCIEIAKEYGATHIINYKNGTIEEQVMALTNGEGVDKVIVAGGDNDTFITAVKVMKPGGIVGNVNYLGEGEYLRIPRVEWGCGMGHKTIAGGLMPGGRDRLEKLLAMVKIGRVDPSKLVTHKFDGFEHIEEALYLMKDKPSDLIKPVVIMK